MRVRYDGPGHRLIAFGKTVLRGAEENFTESETRSLLAQPNIHITLDPAAVAALASEAERPSRKGSRRQWASFAAKHLISVTDDMTRDQIIAAVERGGTTTDDESSEPEADLGAGRTINPDQED